MLAHVSFGARVPPAFMRLFLQAQSLVDPTSQSPSSLRRIVHPSVMFSLPSLSTFLLHFSSLRLLISSPSPSPISLALSLSRRERERERENETENQHKKRKQVGVNEMREYKGVCVFIFVSMPVCLTVGYTYASIL